MFTQIEEHWSAGITYPHTFPLTPPLFPDLHNHNYITNLLTWFLDAAIQLIDYIWNYCRTIMKCGYWLILKYMHVRRSTVIVFYVPWWTDAMKRIRINVKWPLAIWINSNNITTKNRKKPNHNNYKRREFSDRILMATSTSPHSLYQIYIWWQF